MQTPYTRRFLEAFEDLLKRGAFVNQTEFCKAMNLHPNTIAAFRLGRRNATIDHVHKLHQLFHVSLYYIFTGKGDTMEAQPKQPTPEEKSELERELDRERQENAFLKKMLEYREGEIRYLREILKLKVENLEEPDSSNG